MSYALFLLASLAFFYIVAGYPILLKLSSGRRRLPSVAKDLNYEPAVSVIVAVYNGESQLRAKLDVLFSLDYPARLLEIIIVSDGSTDATEAIAEAYSGKGVILIRAPKGGKAAALNYGMAKASGEVIFFTDVQAATRSGRAAPSGGESGGSHRRRSHGRTKACDRRSGRAGRYGSLLALRALGTAAPV